MKDAQSCGEDVTEEDFIVLLKSQDGDLNYVGGEGERWMLK